MKSPEQMKKGTRRFSEELSNINPETGGPRNPAIPLANDKIPRFKKVYNKCKSELFTKSHIEFLNAEKLHK